jgi:PST family polysaccharide transporter
MLISFALDILIGAGATRWSLWLNLGWAVALVPAMLFATAHGGLVGAAAAHAVVGLLVAVPLAVLALRRAGVDLAPIPAALVRPLAAGALTAAVVLVAARQVGPDPLVRLAVGGTLGVLVYVVVAVPRQQLRGWRAALKRETTDDQ